ncbi:MAG: ABC transporter permease [Wenzhouxiangella sp.]|nr:ABC transporter permease [Wenzhouxiangella sp.]
MTLQRALRGLVRTPGFTLGAALILGLASTGLLVVGTAVWQLFFKPLPFVDGDQLVTIHGYSQQISRDIGISVPLLGELEQVEGLVAVAGYEETEDRADRDGQVWRVARVGAGLPDLLGLAPVLGSGFRAEHADPGAPTVALLAESVWQARFDRDPSVLGRDIEFRDVRARIIGIMPGSLTVPDADVQVWLPLQLGADEFSAENMSSFGGMLAIGRLQPGLTPAVFEQRLQQHFADHPGLAPLVQFFSLELRSRSLRDHWTAGKRAPLTLLAVAILAVLLTTLLNLAGLWMSRLLARGHVQAIQNALGAGQWQSLKNLAAEYLIVAALAMGLALMLSVPSLHWLKTLGVIDDSVPVSVAFGPATVMMAIAVAALAGLPILLAGWWQTQRRQTSPAALLGAGGVTARQAPARVRRALIVVQFAVAMALLVCVGLLLRSWHGLLNEDLGFQPQSLLVVSLAHDPDRPETAAAEALEQLAALPGVQSVSHATAVPFGRVESASNYELPDAEGFAARDRLVGPDYFKTLGITLSAGRSFDPDASGPDHAGVVIDEVLAHRYWPDGNAVGQQLIAPRPGERISHEIIGVAGTVRHMNLDEEPSMGTVYRFLPQPGSVTQLVASTSVPPESLIGPVRQSLTASLGESTAQGTSIATMDSLIRRSVSDRQPQIVLLSVFAALALLLSATGLYAVMSYSVRSRTTELGLRMALGADGAEVRRLMLADSIWLLLFGLGLGGVLALVGARLIASQLHGIGSTDPLSWTAATLTLALVLILAGWWPARRAAGLSPMNALYGGQK